jgi:hypothetical protein
MIDVILSLALKGTLGVIGQGIKLGENIQDRYIANQYTTQLYPQDMNQYYTHPKVYPRRR